MQSHWFMWSGIMLSSLSLELESDPWWSEPLNESLPRTPDRWRATAGVLMDTGVGSDCGVGCGGVWYASVNICLMDTFLDTRIALLDTWVVVLGDIWVAVEVGPLTLRLPGIWRICRRDKGQGIVERHLFHLSSNGISYLMITNV